MVYRADLQLYILELTCFFGRCKMEGIFLSGFSCPLSTLPALQVVILVVELSYTCLYTCMLSNGNVWQAHAKSKNSYKR